MVWQAIIQPDQEALEELRLEAAVVETSGELCLEVAAVETSGELCLEAAVVETPEELCLEAEVLEKVHEEVVLAEIYQAVQRKAQATDLAAVAEAVRQGQPQEAGQGKSQAGMEAVDIRSQTVVLNYPAKVFHGDPGKEASSGTEALLKEESSPGIKVWGTSF